MYCAYSIYVLQWVDLHFFDEGVDLGFVLIEFIVYVICFQISRRRKRASFEFQLMLEVISLLAGLQ